MMPDTATAIREKPILFSAPMVLALLDGRKTQTRRIVKPQPIIRKDEQRESGCHDFQIEWNGTLHRSFGGSALTHAEFVAQQLDDQSSLGRRCPYGGPGDRLWVRESWSELSWTCVIGERGRQRTEVVYKAGPHPFERDQPHGWTEGKNKWRPSIHMPRWASRITLEITEVRVERVQDIYCRTSDLVAEGVKYDASRQDGDPGVVFRRLWDQINGKGSWESNPWVWAITFRRLEPHA